MDFFQLTVIIFENHLIIFCLDIGYLLRTFKVNIFGVVFLAAIVRQK